MTTTVEGQRRRPFLNYSSFADITDAELVAMGRDYLEFDGDLTEEKQAQIRARMESVDDDDQAARANLAELLGVLRETPSIENVAAAVAASICYQLGEAAP